MARFGLSPNKIVVDLAGTTRPDRFSGFTCDDVNSIALECIEEGLSLGLPGIH